MVGKRDVARVSSRMELDAMVVQRVPLGGLGLDGVVILVPLEGAGRGPLCISRDRRDLFVRRLVVNIVRGAFEGVCAIALGEGWVI